MLFNIPKVDIGIQYPVAMEQPKRRANRKTRRKAVFGRQHVFDRIAGRLAPKQIRRWQS